MINSRKLLLTSFISTIISTVLLGYTVDNAPRINNVTQTPLATNKNITPDKQNINAPTNIMSDEDAKALEELNKMVQKVERYRQSLPEDQRAQFDREAQEAAVRMQTRMDEMIKNDPAFEEKLKNQDPEAMDLFLQNVLGPEIEQAAQEDQAMEAGPSALPEPGPSVPAETKTEPKKVEKKIDVHTALELIESIIEYLESFKEKMNIVITLQGLYDKWAKDDRLKGWTRDLTWAKFKEKVDSLTDSFYTLKLKDPDTKEYRHLIDLLDNKELYEQLKQFNDDLADNEPRITVPAAGIGELNSASKDAARETINICLRGITKLQTQVTAIIEKYGEKAKKISSEKEKERQKAEQSIKQRKPGYTKPIGIEDRGYNAPYGAQYPDQAYPYTPWNEPSTTPQKSGVADRGTNISDQKDNKKDSKAPQAQTPAKKQEKGDDEKALDTALDQFSEQLSDLALKIQDNKNLQNLGQYMFSGGDTVDTDAAEAIKSMQADMANLTKTVRRAGFARLSRVDASTKNFYMKKFADAVAKDSMQAPLRKLMDDIDTIDKSRNRVNTKKQFVFFDNETRQTLKNAQQKRGDKVDAYADLQANTASIFALRDSYNALKKAIDDLKNVPQKTDSKGSSHNKSDKSNIF